MDKTKQLTMAPYALLCQGEEHECPLSLEKSLGKESPFKVKKDSEIREDDDMEIWATDGSCYNLDDKPVVGYAALRHADGKTLQGTVRPPSAQAAEVIAVVAVLVTADKKITIVTNSEWTLRALIDWMPVWLERCMTTGDGKLVAHSRYLLHAWEMAQARIATTYLCKVKAHCKRTPLCQT